MESSFKNNELNITYTSNAPRELMWKAWTDSARLARWWGPEGFTNPVCELQLQPGGDIHIDMTGPDGTVYPMGGKFQEISEPQKLVFTSTALSEGNEEPFIENLNTITFQERGGKTQVSVNAQVLRAAPEAGGALEGMEEGWKQSLQKLERLLNSN